MLSDSLLQRNLKNKLMGVGVGVCPLIWSMHTIMSLSLLINSTCGRRLGCLLGISSYKTPKLPSQTKKLDSDNSL